MKNNYLKNFDYKNYSNYGNSYNTVSKLNNNYM